MASIDLSDYIPVSERIAKFKEAHPDGSLQSEVVETGIDGYIAVKAWAFRSPKDTLPGIGLAWERVPGPTPFTKDSELQNAETAAWGRALIAALVADASKGVASREEIQNRQASSEPRERTPWEWVWGESEVFKAWDKDERLKAAQVALESHGFAAEPANMDEAKIILEHMRNQYESRPLQSDALPLEEK